MRLDATIRGRAAQQLRFRCLSSWLIGLTWLLAGSDSRPLAAVDLSVEVDGLPREHERNVRSLLAIEEERRTADGATTPARIRQLHAAAPGQIAAALEPFGYYRPVVRASLEQRGDQWVARYEIEHGPPLLLSDVSVTLSGAGANDQSFAALANGFALGSGDELVHADYEQGKQSLVDYAGSHGYLDASFRTAEIRIDRDRYDASIVLAMETGERYLFGEPRFSLTGLDVDLLTGYIEFEPGEPLDLDQLLKLQDELSNSPYFARVEVMPRPEEAKDRRVPIAIDLVLAARQRWDLGIGYGTDTGPRGTVGLLVRRVNRRGHRAEVDLTGSQIEQSFRASYQVPGPFPRTDVVTYSLGYADLAPDSSHSKTALVGVELSQSRGSWRQAYGLTYQRADFEVGLDQGVSELVTPEVSFARVASADRIYPLRGQRLDLVLRGTDPAIGANVGFVQGIVRAAIIRPLGTRFRLLGRATLGYTETADFRRLPPAYRFFAGGDQSVRGFAYQAIGGADEAGNVIGGPTTVSAGIELDSLFLETRWGRFGAAVFYDAGSAAERLGDELATGAGLGVRWLSPIGLVRLDAAVALSEPDRPVRFHLVIGPDL